MGLRSRDGLPCGGRVRPGRRRGWVLRGACQHARRVLVAAAVVAPSPSGDSAREPAAVPGILRVRAQRPSPGQEAVGVADRPLARTTLQSIMSLDFFSFATFAP